MSTKIKETTPFEMALAQVEAKQLQTPSVTIDSRKVDYFAYQLNTHYFNLKIMAGGMKFRGITFTQIKNYYGLKGKSAKDCVPQMKEIVENYATKHRLN